MERQNRPPPLTLPINPPAYLSALSYHRTPSASVAGIPAWASSRRRNLRRTCAPLSNPAGFMLIALIVITGSLTWLLIRGGNSNTSSPLSQLPQLASDSELRVGASTEDITPVQKPEAKNVANSTLNFQQIFAINLPSRLDRKDILTVMAACSNITITIVPGVRSPAENSLPPPRIPGSLRTEEYGVWRAHANVWRRIIEDELETALILEDDNDWDVNLKEQIPRIVDALEEIRVIPPLDEGGGVVRGNQVVEPWDILYLGSCWEEATLSDKKDRKTVVPIPSDRENVAQHNYNWVEDILLKHSQLDPPTRLLQRASYAQCTHSYAVTYRGARKLLYHTSQYLDERLDMAIVDLVQNDVLDAFSVIPPIMVQWKSLEREEKDTDVGYDVWRVHNWGFAHSLRYKLRKDNQVGWDPDPDRDEDKEEDKDEDDDKDKDEDEDEDEDEE